MIGDAQVMKASRSGRLGHLLERRVAVAPCRMAVKRAFQILGVDQVGQLVFLGRLDLAHVFAQLGRDLIKPERLE